MHKKPNDFFKKINKLKTVDPQTDENKVLKPKGFGNVGDLFDELYYIYKDKYHEEKKKKKNNRLLKTNHLKNQQKMMRVVLVNRLIKKKKA